MVADVCPDSQHLRRREADQPGSQHTCCKSACEAFLMQELCQSTAEEGRGHDDERCMPQADVGQRTTPTQPACDNACELALVQAVPFKSA